ncbi:transglutaminaseTgpA domain-containing protein [Curtobacterium sp. NPDC090217]|uniref:transglutaminase family protein n=1 Tax=Curtobacterium sp. NPDC090217 TaxID=3363970 RepID=UPI0037F315FA
MTAQDTRPASRGRADVREILDREDDRAAPSPWVIALAPVPVLLAALAFRPLVQGIAWWTSALAIVVVLVGVVLAVRRRSPGVRFVALVATLIACSCAAALVNDIQPLGWIDGNGALGQTIAAIRLNPAPLPQTDPIRLVVTVAIAWVAAASLFLATVAPAAALAAAPALVILIVPGVVTGTPASTGLVVVTGLAFLALLWLSVRPVQRAFPAMLIGAVALVVAVGLPTIIPLNASWLSGVTGAIQAPIQPGRPGTLLNLGQDLRRPSELEVFRYRSSDGQPEYLKLADLDEFGTGDWVPTVTDVSDAQTADQQQWAVGINPRLASRGDVTVRITGLSSNYLPVPSGAVSIQSQSTNLELDQWRWMGDSNTVRSTGPATRRGATYEVYGASTFANAYLDAIDAAGRLDRFDGRGYPTPSTAQLRTDLALPKDLPKSISTTAARVAGSAETDYEKARTLEEWFRSDLFTYSETAPVEQGYDGDSMDVVAKFLQVREGYCVHFSSAMAVMARTLGIPSRIAVGYRAGGTQEDGEYTVSNRQLHSWPELYIKGAGWVAFEPTPDSDSAATSSTEPTTTPSAADPATPLPEPNASNEPSTSASPTPSASAAPGAAGSTGGSGNGPWGLAVGMLIALAVLVAPATVRAVRRRSRLAAVADGRSPAVSAWRELLDDVADHGYAPGLAPPGDAAAVARTARAVLGRLRSSVPTLVLPFLEAAVDAVDQERYAPAGSVDGAALVATVREARVALDASVRLPQRLRSRLLPPSLTPSSAWSHDGPRRRRPA